MTKKNEGPTGRDLLASSLALIPAVFIGIYNSEILGFIESAGLDLDRTTGAGKAVSLVAIIACMVGAHIAVSEIISRGSTSRIFNAPRSEADQG